MTDRLKRFEKAVLEEALHRHAGDVVAMTEALRVPRKTLYDKFRRHG
ncbi:helix-turn-helix domain-containing protein, partial [Brevundimonas sp.]